MMKTLGQLFCDDSAQQIVDMLVAECEKGGVVMRLRTEVLDVARDDQGYTLQLNGETVSADNGDRQRRPVYAGAGRLPVRL
jgi:predicted flavoprotein YhiN